MLGFIKKNPILTAVSAVVLVAAGITLYQYDFFKNGIDGVRNKIDCQKIKKNKKTYNEKLALCQKLFQRDSIAAIDDDICTDICQQILECETIRKSNSAVELQRFLDKYQNATKVDCYLEVKDRLDALRCEEVRSASDTVRRLSMEQYLDEYGEEGLCSQEFAAALEECENILATDSCQLFYEYIDTKGEAGACYYDVRKKYYNLCVNVPEPYQSNAKLDSSACEKAKAANTCEAYKKYLVLHPDGKCYDEFLTILQERCPNITIPARPSDAIPFRPEEASVYGGRIKGAAPNSASTTSSRRARCQTYTVGGQVFQAIKIGPLLVMCDNLNVPMYNSICYNYDSNNCQEYGELYTYPEALAACPAGWRLPCESEVDFLINTYYSNPGTAFENLSHHARIKFGGFAMGQTFMNMGTEAYFWCATEASDTEAYYYKFDGWQKTIMNGDIMDKTAKMSCRCVSVADELEYVASRISRVRCHNQPN